jgi:hypothetical protein
MPAERHVDPTLPDGVAEQLSRLSHAALEASQELVAHYSDTGDASTQRAVDALIDHLADTLQSLADSLADSSRELRTAEPPTASARQGEGDGSSAGSGHGREFRA